MAQPVRDNRLKGLLQAGVLEKYILESPDSVAAVLYRAVHEPETLTEEQDTVGSIEDEDLTLSYEDPVPATIKFIPSQSPLRHQMSYSGDDIIEFTDEDILMLIAGPDVPNESVIEYQEYISETEEQTVTLMVKHSIGIKRAPVVGKVYYLIPLTDTEGLIDG